MKTIMIIIFILAVIIAFSKIIGIGLIIIGIGYWLYTIMNREKKEYSMTKSTLSVLASILIIVLGSFMSFPKSDKNDVDVATEEAIQSVQDTKSFTYIGDSNSMEFHEITCNSIKNTDEDNKVYFNTRGAAINSKYVPCEICNP